MQWAKIAVTTRSWCSGTKELPVHLDLANSIINCILILESHFNGLRHNVFQILWQSACCRHLNLDVVLDKSFQLNTFKLVIKEDHDFEDSLWVQAIPHKLV